MFEDVNFLLYIFVVVNVFLSLLNYRMTFVGGGLLVLEEDRRPFIDVAG